MSKTGTQLAADEEDFGRLFVRHFDAVVFFFRSRGFGSEEVDDLVQQAFLHAFRSRAQFRGEGSFRGWLFKIAVNIYRNELRRRSAAKRNRPEASLDDPTFHGQLADGVAPGEQGPPSPTRGQLDEILTQERVKLLRQALQELPAQMRQCMLLSLGQNLRYREIAAITGVPLGTVKSQLHSAKARLREKLAAHFPDLGAS